MMQISQAQQNVLDIPSYLINLLSITGGTYCKTLRLKAYNDNLKKHLSGILGYIEVEFFHPFMLQAAYDHCLYQQVGSNSFQIVYSYTSRLITDAYPRTGAP